MKKLSYFATRLLRSCYRCLDAIEYGSPSVQKYAAFGSLQFYRQISAFQTPDDKMFDFAIRAANFTLKTR